MRDAPIESSVEEAALILHSVVSHSQYPLYATSNVLRKAHGDCANIPSRGLKTITQELELLKRVPCT